MTDEWRVATCLQSLLGEVDARWPGRNRTSDGSIGDAAHSKRGSDHNPWRRYQGIGIVRARDFTADGIDADWLAARIVALGIAGDHRLRNGGYVIWQGHIWSSQAGWAKRRYTGANLHNHHVHVSVTQDAPHFDSIAPWGVQARAPQIVPEEEPMSPEDRAYVRSEIRAAMSEVISAVHKDVVTILRGPDHPSLAKILDAVTKEKQA